MLSLRLVFPWRTFYCSCDTEAEMKGWMSLIQWKLVSVIWHSVHYKHCVAKDNEMIYDCWRLLFETSSSSLLTLGGCIVAGWVIQENDRPICPCTTSYLTVVVHMVKFCAVTSRDYYTVLLFIFVIFCRKIWKDVQGEPSLGGLQLGVYRVDQTTVYQLVAIFLSVLNQFSAFFRWKIL